MACPGPEASILDAAFLDLYLSLAVYYVIVTNAQLQSPHSKATDSAMLL